MFLQIYVIWDSIKLATVSGQRICSTHPSCKLYITPLSLFLYLHLSHLFNYIPEQLWLQETSWAECKILSWPGPQNSVFWLGWFCPCQYPCLVWVMMSLVLRRYWHKAPSRNFAECTVGTLSNGAWSQGAESGIWCLWVLPRLGMCSTSLSSTVCCSIVNFITTWLLS